MTYSQLGHCGLLVARTHRRHDTLPFQHYQHTLNTINCPPTLRTFRRNVGGGHGDGLLLSALIGGIDQSLGMNKSILVDGQVAGLDHQAGGARAKVLGEAFESEVAERPGLLLVDGSLERREYVLERQASVLVQPTTSNNIR